MNRQDPADPAGRAAGGANPMWLASGRTGALETCSTPNGSARAKAVCDIQPGVIRKRQQPCTRRGER